MDATSHKTASLLWATSFEHKMLAYRPSEAEHAQLAAAQRAVRRRGELPLDKPDREDLLRTFAQARRVSKDRPHIGYLRVHGLNTGYFPCTTPLQSLLPIHLNELRLEVGHRGRVLFLRTLALPCCIAAIATCVEDEKGNVDRLYIHNERESIDPDHLLPIGTILAIKEPLYCLTGDGGYSVRVDHPSDVVYLSRTDGRVPPLWRSSLVSDISAAEYKKLGNESYSAKKYYEAADFYSKGLAASVEGSLLSCDLFRNRAMVHLCLERFEIAKADALSSIIKSDELEVEMKNRMNNKAFFRAGRAAYNLGEFEAAKSAFMDALDLVPHDKEVSAEVKRCKVRLVEEREGRYDFTQISDAISSSWSSSLDHASFLSNTVIGETSYGGRGVFATKAMEVGELIICEKAFSLTYPPDTPDTRFDNISPDAKALSAIIDKLRNNPVTWAKPFMNLYDGGYGPKRTVEQIDGAAVIDVIQVRAIVKMNVFGAPRLRSSDEVQETASVKAVEAKTSPPRGIWLHASYINHACAANASRSFLGGLMLVKATRAIAVGEEITMDYTSGANADLDKRREKLSKTWFFTCNCALCSAESGASIAQRSRLTTLLAMLQRFLSDHVLSGQQQVDKNVLARAEALYDHLSAVYSEFLATGLPQLGLIDIALWLCHAYSIEKRYELALRTALALLKHAGYHITLNRGSGSAARIHDGRSESRKAAAIRSTSCVLDSRAIDAALCAAHSCFRTGNMTDGKAYQSLAVQFYTILYGEERRYEKRYGRIIV